MLQTIMIWACLAGQPEFQDCHFYAIPAEDMSAVPTTAFQQMQTRVAEWWMAHQDRKIITFKLYQGRGI